PAGPRAALREIDWPGGALSALGLGALVFGLIEGQTYGWWAATRPFSLGVLDWPGTGLSPVPLALAAGAVLLAGLVALERSRAAAGRPVMLDLELFRVPNFRRGSLASSLINVGELGLLFVLPLFLLGVHGTSPLQISVAILPLAVGAFLSGGYAGRLAGRRGPHRVVQIGMVLEVAAVAALGLTVSATTTGFGLAPWMLLYGLGLGLTSAQLTNVSLADVPPARAGQASGTQSTARQVGAALGIAVIGTVFATSLGHAMADRLERTGLPPERRAEIARELRDSAGTYGRDLHRAPGMAAEAHAADASLAVATRRGALTTAAVLALGLALSLRLRPSSDQHREESKG
uniref:MFS transporter n=1 Tax=Actinomadura roseirufa TaxID=2094049 RepID=UPI0010412665